MYDLLDPVSRAAPFAADALEHGLAWFKEDMDGDGQMNGPSDWDTDGDGMPDGFEFCFSDATEHPASGAVAASQILDPANNSDGYSDWDEDGMNNIEEYQVAIAFGEGKFTSPWHEDTDEDGMPDGWEATMDSIQGTVQTVTLTQIEMDTTRWRRFSHIQHTRKHSSSRCNRCGTDDWVTVNETLQEQELHYLVGISKLYR